MGGRGGRRLLKYSRQLESPYLVVILMFAFQREPPDPTVGACRPSKTDRFCVAILKMNLGNPLENVHKTEICTQIKIKYCVILLQGLIPVC